MSVDLFIRCFRLNKEKQENLRDQLAIATPTMSYTTPTLENIQYLYTRYELEILGDTYTGNM